MCLLSVNIKHVCSPVVTKARHTRGMHSCESKYLRDTAIPHLHTANSSKNCSTGMPGRGQVSSLLIKSSIESFIECGGLYLGISTGSLHESYKPNQRMIAFLLTRI